MIKKNGTFWIIFVIVVLVSSFLFRKFLGKVEFNKYDVIVFLSLVVFLSANMWNYAYCYMTSRKYSSLDFHTSVIAEPAKVFCNEWGTFLRVIPINQNTLNTFGENFNSGSGVCLVPELFFSVDGDFYSSKTVSWHGFQDWLPESFKVQLESKGYNVSDVVLQWGNPKFPKLTDKQIKATFSDYKAYFYGFKAEDLFTSIVHNKMHGYEDMLASFERMRSSVTDSTKKKFMGIVLPSKNEEIPQENLP